MFRLAFAAALLAAPLAALPASAAPAISAAMPVIAATVEGAMLSVRLPEGVIGDTKATSRRTITVEAFDASGVSLGKTSIIAHKRFTYATIPLAPTLAGADRLVVSAD